MSEPEDRWEFLRVASKRVLKAFMGGHNPTEQQIDKLKAAIDSVEQQKICGHRFVDGQCDCLEVNRIPAAEPREK